MQLDTKEPFLKCPHCGGNMVEARLRTPGFDNQVFICLTEKISSDEAEEYLLVAWICVTCGCVELHAHGPGVPGE
jgi:hypothetical protein